MKYALLFPSSAVKKKRVVIVERENVKRVKTCKNILPLLIILVCGRPLGLRWFKDNLYVCDAYHGIFQISKDGKSKQLLTDSVNGVKLHFFNDLVIDKNGVIYFTSSSKYDRLDLVHFAFLTPMKERISLWCLGRSRTWKDTELWYEDERNDVVTFKSVFFKWDWFDIVSFSFIFTYSYFERINAWRRCTPLCWNDKE